MVPPCKTSRSGRTLAADSSSRPLPNVGRSESSSRRNFASALSPVREVEVEDGIVRWQLADPMTRTLRSPLQFEEHRWYYRPDCPEALDFESKLSQLLKDLSERSERYQSIRKESEAFVLECTASTTTQREPLGMAFGPRDDPKAGHEFGLELDVDLYVSGPELPD